MKAFPKSIEDFGNAFVTAQVKRQSADYDPAFRVKRSEVITDIGIAEASIRELFLAPIKDRRAFAAWVTMKVR